MADAKLPPTATYAATPHFTPFDVAATRAVTDSYRLRHVKHHNAEVSVEGAKGIATRERESGPFFLVSLTTVPGMRAAGMVHDAVHSLLTFQIRQPDCLLLVAPRSYERFPTAQVNLTTIFHRLRSRNPALRMRYCSRDYGPGSKLLCALPVLRRLARHEPQKWALITADVRQRQSNR